MPLAQRTEDLGMFSEEYAALDMTSQAAKKGGSLWLTVGLLVLGTAAGCVLAVVLGKRKGVRRK